jgi:hypothetical protein
MRRKLESVMWKPVTWRGALVTTVLDARPRAIAHMPGPTLWPFVMSIGFVFLFAAALLHHLIAFIIGAGLTAVSIGGWFLPRTSEQNAIDEVPTTSAGGDLPLAMAGPSANGWWGTIVFCGVLATALATVISSYYYLGDAAAPPLQPARSWPAIAATLGAGISAVCMRLACGARPGPAARPSRIGLLAAIAGTAVSTLFYAMAWRDMGVDAASSAIASSVLGLFAFQWIVHVIFVVMACMAIAWAFWRNHDPRGHGVTANATLISYFNVCSATVIWVVLYVTPALW